MSEDISVLKALTIKKKLLIRLKSGFSFNSIEMQQGDSERVIGSWDKYKSDGKAELQSFKDTLKSFRHICGAISTANATNMVTINEKKMTIIEAIHWKDSLEFELVLLKTLRSQMATATDQLEMHNERVQGRLDRLLEESFGKNSRTKSDEFDAISKPFLAKNEYKLVESFDVSEEIKKLESSLEDLAVDINVALSESNAKIKINPNPS